MHLLFSVLVNAEYVVFLGELRVVLEFHFLLIVLVYDEDLVIVFRAALASHFLLLVLVYDVDLVIVIRVVLEFHLLLIVHVFDDQLIIEFRAALETHPVIFDFVYLSVGAFLLLFHLQAFLGAFVFLSLIVACVVL